MGGVIDSTHRDLPPPKRAWILAQSWCELLFAHWSFSPAAIRPLLPPGLMLDTFGGRAWIGVVPFRMADVHPRGLPGLPGARAFPELNVRTYVTVGELRGVYFFSLDATSKLAIAAARAWFKLPYHHARMRSERDGDVIHYSCERTAQAAGHERARAARASRPGTSSSHTQSEREHAPPRFEADYAPTGPVTLAEPKSLERWLTERYLLFSVAPDGRVLRGDVHHAPWPLQPARAELRVNTMLEPLGLELPGPPESLLYAERVDVQTWSPRTAYRPVSAGRRE
ncbi:MAG: hypothetical protein DHS20C15_30440 [Planctomycetota bacterium]|nr:MAG: hypothetical protein DHS20C15_30440 [Planctomycetota bacterium]